jgi:hypothetical protein
MRTANHAHHSRLGDAPMLYAERIELAFHQSRRPLFLEAELGMTVNLPTKSDDVLEGIGRERWGKLHERGYALVHASSPQTGSPCLDI